MSCQAAIPRAGPLARCIAKLTENRKSPERPIVSGFPGIDTKTALQIGRLFLYESLFLNMVRVVGLEPTRQVLAKEPKSFESTNSTIPAYSTYMKL